MKKIDAEAFIKEHAKLEPVPFVPEITLYQAEEIMPVWRAVEACLDKYDIPVPFWAFVWSGGQAMARHILDHPSIVKGKRVLDFGCGSGVGAIAAYQAGARKTSAADIDPLAQACMALNAAYHGADIEIMRGLTIANPPKNIDLIIAGDVCYEQTMSHRVLRWLTMCRRNGIRVLISDPKRGYAPDRNPNISVTKLANYTVPTSCEIEESTSRDVIIWELI